MRREVLALSLAAACSPAATCPADGVIARARAGDPTHVELELRCRVEVTPLTVAIDAFTREAGAALTVLGVANTDQTVILETSAQTALVVYTVRLDGAAGPDGRPVSASANFVGVGNLATATVMLTVDDRYNQSLREAYALVGFDPATGVWSEVPARIALADGDGDHIWTAQVKVAVDPLRTVSTADDRLGAAREAYSARVVAGDGSPLSPLVTFEVKSPMAAAVNLPLLSVPKPPGPEGLVMVHVRVDDTPARALGVPKLRVSAGGDGAFDPAFPTTLPLVDPDGDHVWEATTQVRIDPDRKIGGTTSETFPYVVYVQNDGSDYPNLGAQVEALGEAPVEVSVHVGNPALIPVTFRIDTQGAYLTASGSSRGVAPGEAVFLTGEFSVAEDAFGQNAADTFVGGENVVLQMVERPGQRGLWERTLFLPPGRTYGWKAVRCPAGKGCGEINRHVTSSGRAFATVMKNLATENRDAQTAAGVKIVDPRQPQVGLDDGRTLDYSGAQVYLGNGTGLEPNPGGLPDGMRLFKQEVPDLVVEVGTAPVATPVIVVGTWRDVNLPQTLAQIVAQNGVFDLNPWDYDSGFVGSAPPAYVLAAPPRFVVGDGLVDAGAKLIPGGSASTMTLHMAIAGNVLYVATEATGAGSDHFVLVSTAAPSATSTPAPWGKAGLVAFPAATVFLAGENDSRFSGWYRLGDGMQVSAGAMSAGTGVLEGTVNLMAVFGRVPDTLHVSAAPYASPDGGAMYPAGQMPATVNGDGNIDAAEIATVKRSDIEVAP